MTRTVQQDIIAQLNAVMADPDVLELAIKRFIGQWSVENKIDLEKLKLQQKIAAFFRNVRRTQASQKTYKSLDKFLRNLQDVLRSAVLRRQFIEFVNDLPTQYSRIESQDNRNNWSELFNETTYPLQRPRKDQLFNEIFRGRNQSNQTKDQGFIDFFRENFNENEILNNMFNNGKQLFKRTNQQIRKNALNLMGAGFQKGKQFIKGPLHQIFNKAINKGKFYGQQARKNAFQAIERAWNQKFQQRQSDQSDEQQIDEDDDDLLLDEDEDDEIVNNFPVFGVPQQRKQILETKLKDRGQKIVREINENKINDLSKKVEQFIENDGNIQKRKRQFKDILQTKLTNKRKQDLYAFQQKPWEFFEFLFDPNTISLATRKDVYKLKYKITGRNVTASNQQLNQLLIEQINEFQRKNTGALARLYTILKKKVEKIKQRRGDNQEIPKTERIRLKRFHQLSQLITFVKKYGQILIDFRMMEKWQHEMINGQLFLKKQGQNQFYFRLKNGQSGVFQKRNGRMVKIQKRQMTKKFLKSYLSKKIGENNQFVMQQFRQMDTKDLEKNKIVQKYIL